MNHDPEHANQTLSPIFDKEKEQLQASRKAWSKANPGKEPTDKQISEQAYQTFYDKAFAASDFGTGGKVQRAIQAAATAVQGLAGGDLRRRLQGGCTLYCEHYRQQRAGQCG